MGEGQRGFAPLNPPPGGSCLLDLGCSTPEGRGAGVPPSLPAFILAGSGGGLSPRLRGQRPLACALALTLAHLLASPASAQEVPGTGSNYGGVGLLEMRNARFRPDGTLEAGAAVRHQRRFYFLSFQALPFLEATFRLTERLDGTTGAGITNDRAFDLKLRLVEEGDVLPAVAVGLQDFVGTGIYSGEYIVASKRFGPLDVTAGIGWGRLGTAADVQNPLHLISPRFEDRPREVGEGGTINAWPFFRGEDSALFGGLEYSLPPLWTPMGTLENVRGKIEVTGDTLRDERGGYPARQTNLRGQTGARVNAGLQWSSHWLDAGVSFVHGTDLLFRVSARLDPERPPEPERPPVPAMAARPLAPSADPVGDAKAALRAAGFQPVAVELRGRQAWIAVAGGRQRRLAQAAGRVLRAVQPHLPREVDTLVLSWRQAGVEIARLTMPRQALEAAARGEGSAEEAFFAARLDPAGADEFGRQSGGVGFTWGVEPRITTLLGDPSRTLRWQAAAVAGARLELGQGFAFAGSVSQTLAGNLDGAPPSNSLLPRVRSDIGRYAEAGTTAIPALYTEVIRGLAPDVFGRVTGGYLEPMFAGVSAELLWRPQGRPWGVGVDIAQVRQRDYDQRFGLQDYNVTTGHVSLYGDLPWFNMYGVVRGGRYLAGDWGGTIELGRRFESGIEVGAFATFTDVPFSTFGEGSFDRGIYVRLPLDLFGVESRTVSQATIRGVTRDGGARLAVDNPLWEVTRGGRAADLRQGYSGFTR